MIDWLNLGANALWILGCALGLAGLSHASWEASLRGVRLRRQLGRASSQRVFSLAGTLFSLGLAGTSDSSLETALWLALALAFLIQIRFIRRGK